MRISGWIRIAVVTATDSFLAYELLGTEGAVAVVLAILLYAWIGERIDLLRDGAVGIENLNECERERMESLRQYLVEDVRRASDMDISGIRLHIISSNVPNAVAYGFGNIAVTRLALNNCDDATLCAVLAHEASHVLCLDAVFRRMIFANVTILILGISICSLVSMSFLWILFFILAIVFRFFRGLFGFLLFRGIGNVVRGGYTVLQYAVLLIYRTVMGLVSRNSEYRADSFSCQLGYGPQLQYFLERFASEQEMGGRTLDEILYASHPPTVKRISRIEQQMRSAPPDRAAS